MTSDETDLILHGLSAIAQITSVIMQHKSGSMSAEDASRELATLHADALAHADAMHAKIADDRAAADKALKERFDTSEGK